MACLNGGYGYNYFQLLNQLGMVALEYLEHKPILQLWPAIQFFIVDVFVLAMGKASKK